MSSSYQIQQLLEKTKNGDPDVRWMACSDIQARAQEPNFTLDDATEIQLVEQILSLFNDNNSEVKSQAARAISMLVGKVKEARVQTIIEKLTSMTGNKDETLRDIASLGLRSVIKEIAPESTLAQTACNKLSPKVLQQLKNTDSPQDLLIQLIEVLGDIYSRFENTLRANPSAQSEGLAGLTPLLNDSRGAVRKRTIRTLGSLIASSGDKVLSNLVDNEILPSLDKSLTEQLKTTISLCSTLTASAPRRMGKRLSKVVPAVLNAAQSEDEELKEIALQALETFLLKCSPEMSAHITATVNVAATLVKYDPNYAGADDEEMNVDSDAIDGASENGDEDIDDDFEEEYEDDDDVSWKVRRSAVKVLEAAIETRLDLLAPFYRSISPVLISRFGEREESVRLEVWNTYTAQLRQTGIWASSLHSSNILSNGLSHLAIANEPGRSSRAASPASSLKRKRDVNASDESPVSALSSQAQIVAKAVIKQLAQTKSVAIRQAGFALLTEMITVLPGGIDSSAGNLVSAIEIILNSGGHAGSHMAVGNTSITLKIQIFSFLSLFFKTHTLRVIQPHAKQLIKLITTSLTKDVPKVGAAALSATSGLVVLLCAPPSGSGSPAAASSAGLLKELFTATVASLSSNSVDQDVRERGILCLGELVVHAGSDVDEDLPKALIILKDRLRNENTRLVSLLTITKIADSTSVVPANESSAANHITQLLLDTTDDMIAFLRKNNNPVQTASFHCLGSIIKKIGQLLSNETAHNMLVAIQQTLTAPPDTHTARALSLLAALVNVRPQLLPEVQDSISPLVINVIASGSASSGQPLEALLRFMSATSIAGSDSKQTIDQLTKIVTAKQTGLQTIVVVSRCIGAIHRSAASRNEDTAERIVGDVATAITAPKQQASQLSLSLLTIGEIGRRNDLRAHQSTFLAAVGNLTNANEEIRSAAAYAVGNMAAGSPSAFLPAILIEIQQASKDDRKLHLLLGAVKETLSHSSADALSGLSEALWQPLFQICEAASDQQKAAADSTKTGGTASSARVGDDARLDGTRNIAAECLGKITLSDPAVYLPQLQSRLHALSAGTRAAVITAIRFTFTDSTSTYDDLLAPIIVQFLSLMQDSDLDVRRLAVSSLTAAVHNKPQIIRDHLATLQPLLYQETHINPALIHEVKMGPFTVKVDEGLSIRKAAYQCMYTLLETCFTKLDMKAYLDIVINGISDDDDIKVSSFLMLVKLRTMAPTAIVQRLDAAAAPFDTILKAKTKETSVKQEIEKLAEMQRSALRTMATLVRIANAANCPKFMQLIQETRSSALWGSEFKLMITAAEEAAAGPAVEAQTMDLD